jgi:hypothetical protein
MISIKLQGRGFEDFKKALQERSQASKQLGNTSIQVVSNAEYSGYVDQGTRYMSAQPFFQETLESHSLEEIGPDPTPDKIRQYAENVVSDMKSRAPVDTGNLVDNIQVEG